jgi:acetyltransferase
MKSSIGKHGSDSGFYGLIPFMDQTLLPFFHPRGVVVIGASTVPEKLGYGVSRNLIQSGYKGAIHFVSQKQGTLFDRPIHTDLGQIPDPIDLAILIVPPQAAVQTLRACGKRGIHAVILVSAGFREIGPEGAALEAECIEVAREYQIRIIGPNCIGVLDTHVPFDSTFLPPPMPTCGDIGFLSHSGAFCAAIVDWARSQAFGFSRIVSLGNQADVTETDLLPILANDVHTRVIAMYIEGLPNGRRFMQVAQDTVRSKPIVALKVGRYESGQKAAASHTGALAGADNAFDAAFAKAGILRADTAEQMFDWAHALASCPLPAGRRMAVLTNAGGPGVIAADALETNGLLLSRLSEETLKTLEETLPPAASTHNPVDMLASASPDQYALCLRILLEDAGVDGVMVILPPPPMFEAAEVATKVVSIIKRFNKPVVIALMGSALVEHAIEVFRAAGVPTYPFPERAASALSVLVKRNKFLSGPLPALTISDANTGFQDPQAETESAGQQFADPLSLLSRYEIPVAEARLARDPKHASAIAQEIGFPVVMKIASPDITHKSDVGGVLLGLKDLQDVISGYSLLRERVSQAKPQARIDGVLLQREVQPGQEVIVGMVRDPIFGPLMMVGSGGVEVEGLQDVAFALAPLSFEEASAMIERTWAGRKLKGFRNILPADHAAVANILVRLSVLAIENEQVQEIEINPLRVLSRGAIAVDVRMKSSQADMNGES